MRLDVSDSALQIRSARADSLQDLTVQKFTGKTDRVDVMSALRQAKNSM